MEDRLKEQQKVFIKTELGLTEEEFFGRKENVYDQLIDGCAAIEIEETIKAGDNDLSPKGVMVVEMVDFVHCPYLEGD